MIRSIAYVTLTAADTNYQVGTGTDRLNISVINDSGGGSANANTARVFVGSSADNITAKMPIGLGGAASFENQMASALYARSTVAGQIVCIVVED